MARDLQVNVKISQVACSFAHTMALSEEGVVYSWGGTLGGKRGDEKGRGAGEKSKP